MKIYFLSARPCALTLNDTYFGITDTFERFAEISLKDRTFVRFAPEGALPIGFFLTENIKNFLYHCKKKKKTLFRKIHPLKVQGAVFRDWSFSAQTPFYLIPIQETFFTEKILPK